MEANTTGAQSRAVNAASRATLVQEADPYYPHTPWRSVVFGAIIGLAWLGFTTLFAVIIDSGRVGWFQVLTACSNGAIVAAILYFGRGVREQILVSQGKIPEKETRT